MAKDRMGILVRAAVACACMAALQATAATRVYWTNATGDNMLSTAGNWKDEAGNVLTAPPATGGNEATGSILVFTNFTDAVGTTADGIKYYGYVFGEGSTMFLAKNGTYSKNIYVYGGGVTHEGTGVNVLGHTTRLSAPTNVFDVVNADAELQFNNGLADGGTRVLLKRGKGTLKGPNAYGSAINNIKEILMQSGTFTLSTPDPKISLTDCTITFDGNDPSARIKRQKNSTPCTVLALTGGCIRETESVDNTEHGFTDDGNAYTLSLTHNIKNSRFTGTIYSKLSFLWGPTDGSQTFTFAKATHPTTGSFTVTNGIVRLVDGAKFTSLAAVTVKDGATLDVASGVEFAIRTAALELESGATLSVAAGTSILTDAISTNGVAIPAGIYTKDNCAWVTGDGTVLTTEWPADKPGDVWNRRDFPAALAAGVETWYQGAELDGANMSLTAGEGATAVIGPLGVKTAGEGKTYTWSWPTFLYGAQEWISTNGDTLVVSAPIDNYLPGNLFFKGNGGVSLAVSQDSETRFVFDGPEVAMGGVTIANPVSVYGTTFTTSAMTTTNTFNGLVTVHNSMTVSKGTWRFTGGVDSPGSFNMSKSGGLYAIVIVDNKPFVSTSRFQPYTKVYLNVPSNTIATSNHAYPNGNDSHIYATAPYALWRGNPTSNGTGGTCRGNQRISLGFYCGAQNNPSKHGHYTGALLDLGGYDQEIASLCCSTNGAVVTSERGAQLHYVLDTFSQNAVFGFVHYAVTNYAHFTGGAGLTYEGSLTNAMLVEESTTTGRLEVASGKLTLAAPAPNMYSGLMWPGGSWPNASAVAVRGGTLAFGHNDAIGRDTDVEFEGADGRLEIAAGAMVRCRYLTFDGVRQAPGLWGAPGGTAIHKDAHFAGTGNLLVVGDGLGTMILFR